LDRRGKKPDILDSSTQGVRMGASKVDAANRRTISLYVPDHARPAFEQILDEYLNGELTPIEGSAIRPVASAAQWRLRGGAIFLGGQRSVFALSLRTSFRAS
jgi:hypothetical protein